MTRREILTTALTVLLIGGLFAIASPALAGDGVADEPFESTGGEFEATAQSGNVTLELDPSSVSVASGETALFDVVVNHTTGDNNGIGGYNDVNVSVGDTSTAQIDSYNLTTKPGGDSSEITGNNQTLSLGAVTFASFSTAQPTYTIANVTVEGVSSSGSTGLGFDPSASNTIIDFDGNFTYTVDGFDNSTVDVSSQTPEAALSNLQVAGQGSSASIVWGDQNDTAVDVENIGGADGSFDVRLVVENSTNVEVINQTTSQQVLQGQTETVTFQDVTAGLAPDSYDVNVTALANDSTTGTLTITEGSVDGVNLTPGADQSITAGTDIEFGAEAVNRNGNVVETSDQPFDWDAEGGSIANITGTFTERTAGTYNVTATLDGVTSAPTLVTITPDDTDTVTISPSGPVSTTAGTGIDFSAEALDRFDNTVESADSNFSWGGDGGSINSTGFFNATTADDYNVTATVDFVTNETQVTVEPAPADSVSITPPGPEFPTAGDTVAFSAEAFDQFGNLNESDDSQFIWDAEGGSISTDGLFDETTTGTYNVTATLRSATSDETTVTVAANDTVDVQISPSADQTIQSGGTVPFDATAFDQFGNVNESTDSSFNWDAEGGSIGISGLFDETTTGTYNVTATQPGTGVTSNETQVTVTQGIVDRVQISPSTDQAITAGGQAPFNATAFDSDDNVVEDDDSNFNWDAEGGSISGSGVFSETTAGTYNVTAELGGQTSAPTLVTVTPAAMNTVTISPSTDQTIQSGGSIPFSAEATDQFGNVNESTDSAFTWAAEGSSISGDGLFDETATGTYNVTAALDGVTSSPTAVTVNPSTADRVEIEPSVDQTLTAGDTIPFNATAFDAADNVVETDNSTFNWAAEGGSISTSGVFSETDTGTYNVTASLGGVTSDETLVAVQSASVDSVTISATGPTTIAAGGQVGFNATALDQFGNIVEDGDSQFDWSPATGVITGSGVFDEQTAGTYDVSASISGVTSTATTVTVNPAAVDTVTISPSADQTVTAGTDVAFSAEAFDQFGNVNESTDGAFTWSSTNGGSINATGYFEGPSTGTYDVTASLDGLTSTATTVTVNPAAVNTVTISPAADQTIQSGGSQSFSAEALDQFGNLNESTDSAFSWAAEGGSISGDGLFDETSTGTYNVTATLDGVTSVPTAVTVEQATIDRVEIDPATDRAITAGDTVGFNATAFDASDSIIDDTDGNFTWEAEGESISTDGVFSETTAGTYNVTASLDGIGSAPTEVTVTADTVDTITLSPSSDRTITAGDTVGFDASALDQFGNLIEDDDSQFTWDASGGSIGGTGVFGDTNPGTYDVTAAFDGTTSAPTRVTVQTGALDSVEITPAADQTIQPGETLAFSATARDPVGNVVESVDGQFNWSAEGGAINATGAFSESTPGTYNVTAEFGGITSPQTTVTVTASQPEVGPDADLRIGGAAVTSILTGEDGDVFVDVTNVGQAAASFELALEFQTPDGTTVGGFDTVNTSELGPNDQETVSFSGVTGDLTVVGFYDIVVSATQSGEQFNDTDAFSVAVDVNDNGEPAAEVPGGPPGFDNMFADVDGIGPDRITIIDVLALFENLASDKVQDNKQFFEFNDPNNPDPDTINILDVVALFEKV